MTATITAPSGPATPSEIEHVRFGGPMAGEVLAIEAGAINMRRLAPEPHIHRVLCRYTGTPVWYIALDNWRVLIGGGICCFRGACEICKWIRERGWEHGKSN